MGEGEDRGTWGRSRGGEGTGLGEGDGGGDRDRGERGGQGQDRPGAGRTLTSRLLLSSSCSSCSTTPWLRLV